jgi:hypothetical protein
MGRCPIPIVCCVSTENSSAPTKFCTFSNMSYLFTSKQQNYKVVTYKKPSNCIINNNNNNNNLISPQPLHR